MRLMSFMEYGLYPCEYALYPCVELSNFYLECLKEGGKKEDIFLFVSKEVEVEMRENIPTLTLPNLTY